MNAIMFVLLLSTATPEIIDRWGIANFECRGGTTEEAHAWCDVREGYSKVLEFRGWCYEGEPFPEWRECVKG
jgi:hypothetical protein